MKVVGLTGGIGSGKTTVAGFFRDLGIPVYIADEEAKKLMNADREVMEGIRKLLGEESYKEGKLDRKYVAGLVFEDKEKLESLNAIVHPAVAEHFEQWKKQQQADYVIYEAAILFEKGGYKKCDFTILVTAPYELKIERLVNRDQSSIRDIRARMENQWSDDKKAALADFIIENRDLSATWEKVQRIHQKLLNTA